VTERDESAIAHAVAATFNSLLKNDLPQYEGVERIERLLCYHLNPWCTEGSQKMLDTILDLLVEPAK
jgi:hypothetical protein